MKKFVKFLFVGAANTVLGYTVIFACMYLAKLSPEVSNLVGYCTGLLFSFSLNRLYTFESRNRYKNEFVKFLIVFAAAYSLNLVSLVVLIRFFLIDPLPGQIIAGTLYIATSYLLNKYYVFRS